MPNYFGKLFRWKNSRPKRDWVNGFRARWKGRVRVRKPRNIKRARAKVPYLPTGTYLPTVSTGTPTIIKLNASNLAIQYHTQVYDVSNLVGHGAQVR